jgi:cell division protein FtsB
MNATIISILIGVLGFVIVAVGGIGAWSALRVGKQTQTVKNFRDAAESWRQKSESQDNRITELENENTELRKVVADLQGQVSVLRDLATGTSAILEHDAKADRRQDDIMARLGAIEAIIRTGA